MASVKKFTLHAVVNQLRHNERTIDNPSNKDIDQAKTNQNYSLIKNRGMSSYEYFLKRKKELYCYGREDVKVMVGWVVTAPKNLKLKEYNNFFNCVYEFLIERYGKNNCIQAIIHNDESGSSHLHFCFIPVVKDSKHGGEKICANNVINRRELRNFHPELNQFLQSKGIITGVMSGITQKQGGNKSVRELKRERQHEYNMEYEKGRW